MEDNSLKGNMKKLFITWAQIVGNLNNYVINGLKEWVKTFVSAMKPINKILALAI